MILALYRLSPGVHTYSYKARVISEGTFQVPPATVVLMYAPEINAHSGSETITIDKTSVFTPPVGTTAYTSDETLFSWRVIIIGSIVILLITAGFIFYKKSRMV